MIEDDDNADETEIGPAASHASEPPATEQQRPCLVVLRGTDAGHVFALEPGETLVGRAAGNRIRLREGSVSRVHLRLTRTGTSVKLEDLSSIGTSVNGQRVSWRKLSEGDRISLGGGTEFMFTYVDASNDALEANLLAAATRDPLTGAWSRRHLIEQLEQEVAYAQRHGEPLAVIIVIPVWHEKRHEPESILNAVIAELAERIRGALGKAELFARWSDDTFAIVARGATDAELGTLRLSVSQAVTKAPIDTDLGARNVSLRVVAVDWSAKDGSARDLVARIDAAAH